MQVHIQCHPDVPSPADLTSRVIAHLGPELKRLITIHFIQHPRPKCLCFPTTDNEEECDEDQ